MVSTFAGVEQVSVSTSSGIV